MKIHKHKHVLRLKYNPQTAYPALGIVFAVLLIYLSPFTGSLTSYPAFLLCLYRVFRYDAKVFATDYCLLIPLAQIFCTTGGMSFLVYLSLLAAVWYFVKTGIRASASYLLLILLMNYLLARMQMNISNFLLCFGQLCVLCIILPAQDQTSAVRTVKLFCIGVVISSFYSLIFRNTWQLRSLLGPEDEAIWGTGIRRFYGFYRDPNYYMTLLIIGLAMISKLKNCNLIGTGLFLTLGVCMTLFGILTYSKMFFLTFVLFGVIYIIWRFRDRKYFWGILLTIAVLIATNVLLSLEIEILETLLARLKNATNISELTTGRTDVYVLYMAEITKNIGNFLFGVGLNNEGLYKDAHNLFLEMTYYIGVVGLVLMLAFVGSMVRVMQRKTVDLHSQSAISKYVTLLLVAVLYCSLHGMFQMMFYGGLFVALLSIMVSKKMPEPMPVVNE